MGQHKLTLSSLNIQAEKCHHRQMLHAQAIDTLCIICLSSISAPNSFNLPKIQLTVPKSSITGTYKLFQVLGLIFFNTWFTDFFLKILRSEEGKK